MRTACYVQRNYVFAFLVTFAKNDLRFKVCTFYATISTNNQGKKMIFFLSGFLSYRKHTLNSVFVDASINASQSKYFANIQKKSWFGWTTNDKRKCVRKPILANPVTRIFKHLSLVQPIVVPPGETNISKLLTTIYIFIRLPFLKDGSTALHLVAILRFDSPT